ncbi:hypothetical protein JCM10212_007145 [Sporobolomyces blumeae]
MLRTVPIARRTLQGRALPLARRLATTPPPSPPAPVTPLSPPVKQEVAHPNQTIPHEKPSVATAVASALPSKPSTSSLPSTPSFSAPPPPPPPKGRLRSFLVSTALFLGTSAFLLYAYDSRAGVHRWLAVPALMALTKDDPERAHELAVAFLESGLAPKDFGVDDERLAFELWGKKFSNPVGIAAGFDKHGQAIDGLFDLGFGYVEIGSVTPVPQPGNPKPRVFRVPETNSVVNRYGFNSEGHDAVVNRLRTRIANWLSLYASVLPSELFPAPPSDALLVPSEYNPVAELLASPKGQGAAPIDALGVPRSLREGKVLGINLGKNKASDPDSIDDFVKGVHSLGPFADVLVVNVSSPNTPGLRNLQRKGMLSELLEGVVKARNDLKSDLKPPVLVKVAPDLTDEQVEDIAYAVKAAGVDGVIVSNTTISRPPSAGSSPTLKETGGLSGPPVKPLALKALRALYEQTDGKVPLIGCGGISSGADALEYAKAGASLVQLYTGFVYGGVGLPAKIKDELTELLKKEGKTWGQVIGTGRAKPKELEQVAEKKVEKELAEKIEPPSVEAFQQGLSEAKVELESLFKQLADAEPKEPTKAASKVQKETKAASPAAPAPPAETTPPAPLAASLPASDTGSKTPNSTPSNAPQADVAVPAPVAEATIPAEATNPLTTPTPATTAKPPTPDSKLPESASSAASPAKPSTNIDHSALAVPATALLDDKAISALLDPAKSQVEQGVAPLPTAEPVQVKVEEKTNLHDGKRWV